MDSDAELEKAEYIDRFLRGELTPPEQAAFRQQLHENQAFAVEVEKQQSVRSVIRQYGRRQQLAAIHQQIMAERRRSSSAWWGGPMRIAAAIALLIACSVIIGLSALSGDSLVNQAYEPYWADVTRGNENTSLNPSSQLLREYANGRYAAAARLFEQHHFRGHQEIFIAANAYLALSQPARAIPLLQRVEASHHSSEDDALSQDAAYYLAWAYFKNNQLPEADALFSSIYRNPRHPYHAHVNWRLYYQLKLLRLKKGV